MNGPKIKVDVQEDGVVVGEKGRHHHHHGVVKLVTDLDITKTIEADTKLVQDHSTDRAHFQGRFRKTVFGDFKNRSGHTYEMTQAQIEDHEREDAKTEVVEAAFTAGAIVEENPNTTPLSPELELELHRLADDGGPAHD